MSATRTTYTQVGKGELAATFLMHLLRLLDENSLPLESIQEALEILRSELMEKSAWSVPVEPLPQYLRWHRMLLVHRRIST